MENYFTNLENMDNTFRDWIKLERINRIPKSVNNFIYSFYGSPKLNMQFDFSENNIQKDKLMHTWHNCTSLTYTPILPSNYKGNLTEAFRNTKITTAPVLSNGVTSLNATFRECPNLTTVGTIPTSCADYNNIFRGCSKLASVPETGWKGDMTATFAYTPINQKIVINSASTLDTKFGW